MWMTLYIAEIKRQFRDVYKFKPSSTGPGDEPIFDNVPDGDYPMTIDGRLDRVKIVHGKISCCNFEGTDA